MPVDSRGYLTSLLGSIVLITAIAVGMATVIFKPDTISYPKKESYREEVTPGFQPSSPALNRQKSIEITKNPSSISGCWFGTPQNQALPLIIRLFPNKVGIRGSIGGFVPVQEGPATIRSGTWDGEHLTLRALQQTKGSTTLDLYLHDQKLEGILTTNSYIGGLILERGDEACSSHEGHS
jgi:hypothetical protein